MGSVRRTRRAPWTSTAVVSVDMFASEAKSVEDLTSFTPAGNPPGRLALRRPGGDACRARRPGRRAVRDRELRGATMITLSINGTFHSVDVPADLPLLGPLRHVL